MDYVEIWRKVIIGDNKSWVLLDNGTCVIFMELNEDLTAQTIDIMKEYGPVHVGSSSADMRVIKLTNYPGWEVIEGE